MTIDIKRLKEIEKRARIGAEPTHGFTARYACRRDIPDLVAALRAERERADKAEAELVKLNAVPAR